MYIKKPGLNKFRNEEFFQFFTEIKELVLIYGYEGKFFGEFEKLLALYSELDFAMDMVRKSVYTSEIADMDNLRDMNFSGLRDTVKAAQYHYDEEKQKAASKLMLVLNSHGNIRKKEYAAETTATYNLIKDLREKFANETAILELQGWVDKLEEYNSIFSSLINTRDKEMSLKSPKRVVDIRKEIELCYANIIRCIEVETISEIDEKLMNFINELTSKIDRYRNTIALRQGKIKNSKI